MRKMIATPENALEHQPLLRRAYNMRETAEILGISYMSVWRLSNRGLLRASKALRTKIFSVEEIARFLQETSV